MTGSKSKDNHDALRVRRSAKGPAMTGSNDNAGKLAMAGPARKDRVPSEADDPIALALQRLHHQVVNEDVPDAFLDLLSAIDEKAARPATPKSDTECAS